MKATKNKRLVIIHFQPIEYYPPVHNAFRTLAETLSGFDVYLFTTFNNKKLESSKYKHGRVIRLMNIERFRHRWLRFFGYIYFNLLTTMHLIMRRPEVILYYETQSSFPVFFYSYIFRGKSVIFVHYHEYTTPQQYQSDMKLWVYFHKLELSIYKAASWVSHTNKERLELFRQDLPNVNFLHKLKVLPNFPPKKWFQIAKEETEKRQKLPSMRTPIRLVYLGSLSTLHMYTKETFQWIKSFNGDLTLDIYSINIKDDVKNYLDELECSFIKIMPGINYDRIPYMLSKYNVGLILYKANSPNVVYSAPNKLFEYLACGLDVWFSSDLISSRAYSRQDCYPKVLEVNFQQLYEFNWQKAIDRTGLAEVPSSYYCESIYKELADNILHEVSHT